MRALLPALVGLALASSLGAQDFARQLEAAQKAKDHQRAEKVLGEWGRRKPDDPNYYIKGANHFYRLANAGGGVSVSTKKPEAGDFILTDPKTGRVVGSVGSSGPDPATLRRAIELLTTATGRFPRRLDIRLGLVTLYEAADDFDRVLETLRQTVAYAKANPDGLLGREGRPYPPPVDRGLALEISRMVNQRFGRETPKADAELFALATLTADSFPDLVYGHNMLGTYYSAVQPDYAKAVDAYERALKIAPNDSLVWSNFAELHRRNDRMAEARACYEKILALNNDAESVKTARERLAKLPK